MSAADPVPPVADIRWRDEALRGSATGDEGIPLVLVNGLGAGLDTWAPLRRALGPRRTIAFDPPGVGASSTPLRPYSIAELADAAFGVADAFGAGEIDVLGYSFGGAVAQEMARARPARVHRLVLAATSCGWGSPPGDPAAVFDSAGRAVRATRKGHMVGFWWQLVAISTWSSLPWLATLTQPTLVIGGEDDRVVRPSSTCQLARLIPDARLVVVPRADHQLFLDGHAPAVATAIAAFLDGETDRPAQPAEGSLACT